ncbi:hypothetical protein C8Q70DRAFT_392799 [Cubamyces menziesii]|nr:hypothetical protein C8Q70DRAFT_392799 [Cubamyces menziesii]
MEARRGWVRGLQLLRRCAAAVLARKRTKTGRCTCHSSVGACDIPRSFIRPPFHPPALSPSRARSSPIPVPAMATKTVRPTTTRKQQQPPAATNTSNTNTSITLSLNLNSSMLSQLGVEPPRKAPAPAPQQAKPRVQPQVRCPARDRCSCADGRDVSFCRESLPIMEATRLAPRARAAVRPVTETGMAAATAAETVMATATSSVDSRTRARRTVTVMVMVTATGTEEGDKGQGGRVPAEALTRRAMCRLRRLFRAKGLRMQGKMHRGPTGTAMIPRWLWRSRLARNWCMSREREDGHRDLPPQLSQRSSMRSALYDMDCLSVGSYRTMPVHL